MSEKKTLGQVYREGCDEARRLFPSSSYDREAYSHAALIRAVMAEQAKVSIYDRPDVAKWKTDADGKLIPEPPKPSSPMSGTSNTGPIIACDVRPEAASEAGDWAAREAWRQWRLHHIASEAEEARGYREAAERHYGPRITDLQGLILGKVEHAKLLADRLDAMEVRSKAQQESIEKLRQERDAAAKAVECHKSYHDTERAIKRAETAERERDTLKMYLQGAEVYQRESRECHAMLTGKGEMAWCMVHPTGELETDLGKEVLAVRQRAESAESERDRIAAELAEMKGLRDAMEWSLKNTAVGWSVQNSEWEVWQNGIMIAKAKDRTDAILAAFRAKGKEPQA